MPNLTVSPLQPKPGETITLAFLGESGAETYLWRPADFDAIQATLTGGTS